jgi:hypothetical protein
MNRKERRAATAQGLTKKLLTKKMLTENVKKLTPDERLVLEALVSVKNALTPAQIGEMTGLAQYQIEAALSKLCAQDVIIKGSTKKLDSKFALGELTVAPHGDGWIVLEAGQRVGGTLQGDPPFSSQEAALRWVKVERAGYEESLAEGDFSGIARAKLVRQTDPELWARFDEAERQHQAEGDDQIEAHRDGGTLVLLMQFIMTGLEAEGVLQSNAEGRMSLTEANRRYAIKETTGEDLQ